MKPKVCKCCGKRIIVEVVQPPTHLCDDCAWTDEASAQKTEDEKVREKNSKIIFLDRFR